MAPTSQVIVITGASGGLGSALANEFTTKGWQVVGTGRSPKPERLPSSVSYHQFDASDAAECASFWRSLSEKYGNAEICLVNNAGGYISGGLVATKPEEYAQQMNSCYFSAVYMTRSLAEFIPKARIINIISSSALAAHKNNSAYGAAKAAEKHFFQALQLEFKPEQYQITNLYPHNISADGPDPQAMNASDLGKFVCDLAESNTTLYLRDVTIYPRATSPN